MHPILTLAAKDLRLLLRDRLAFFFTLVFPLIFGVLFGLIFSGGGSGGGTVPLGVVDLDGSAFSRAYAARLEEAEVLRVTRLESASEAREMVRLGRLSGVVVLPEGFGAAPERLFDGVPVGIDVLVDPARSAEAAMIEGILHRTTFERLAVAFEDAERTASAVARSRETVRAAEGLGFVRRELMLRRLASVEAMLLALASEGAGAGDAAGDGADAGGGGLGVPVEVRFESVAREGARLRNAFELTFPQASAWAMIGCVTGFGLSLVSERSRGTLMRLVSGPVRRSHVLAGKALACFVGATAVQVVLQGVGWGFFDVRPSSLAMLALAVLCISFGFTGLMMLLAALGQSEGAADGLARAILLVMALIGGAGVPLFVMPDWMRTVSGVSPFKWGIVALEGATFRAYSPGEMLLPCAILVGVGVAGLVTGAALFRRWSVS